MYHLVGDKMDAAAAAQERLLSKHMYRHGSGYSYLQDHRFMYVTSCQNNIL